MALPCKSSEEGDEEDFDNSWVIINSWSTEYDRKSGLMIGLQSLKKFWPEFEVVEQLVFLVTPAGTELGAARVVGSPGRAEHYSPLPLIDNV